MDGIETLGRLVILAALLLVTIPWTSAALVWLTAASARTRGLMMLLGTLGLIMAMLHVLVGLPVFDFVERCRPDGSGQCHTGQSYAATAHMIKVAQWQAAAVYLGLPLLLGTALGVWIGRTKHS